MSDTIVGAIIGAAIASLGSIIGLLTWTRNLKYQILRDERDRLEKKLDLFLNYYLDCLKKNAIDGPLASAFTYEFTEPIRVEFETAVQSGAFSNEVDTSVKQQAYFNMAYEMSKAKAEYEQEIRKTYELVDAKKAMEVARDIIKRGLINW